MQTEFNIHPQLSIAINPLSADQLKGLRELIVKQGKVNMPLLVWEYEGDNYLIDGHHRWQIIQEEGITDFEVKPFAGPVTIDGAIDWIRKNAANQRNMSKQEEKYARGNKLAEMQKQGKLEKQGAPKGNSNQTGSNQYKKVDKGPKLAPLSKKAKPIKSRKKPEKMTVKDVSDLMGVDKRRLERDKRFKRGIDIIREHMGEHVVRDILKGKIKGVDAFIEDIVAAKKFRDVYELYEKLGVKIPNRHFPGNLPESYRERWISATDEERERWRIILDTRFSKLSLDDPAIMPLTNDQLEISRRTKAKRIERPHKHGEKDIKRKQATVLINDNSLVSFEKKAKQLFNEGACMELGYRLIGHPPKRSKAVGEWFNILMKKATVMEAQEAVVEIIKTYRAMYRRDSNEFYPKLIAALEAMYEVGDPYEEAIAKKEAEWNTIEEQRKS